MSEARSNGCNGRCCEEFPVGMYTHAELLARVAAEPQHAELQHIAGMVIYLRDNPKRGNAIYTCRHFDAVKRLCMDYENRPNMCRDYPYDDGNPCVHCWQTLTQISGLELAA